MGIKEKILQINKELPPSTKLVAVSKFKPVEAIQEAYEAGQRVFAESRPQELKLKAESLPNDIQWHFIGHLQTNKIKMVVPYTKLIHSIDSERLLLEVADYARKHGYHTELLLELFIAQEESKQGFSADEILDLFDRVSSDPHLQERLSSVTFKGLMGMASFVDDETQIRAEFSKITSLMDEIKKRSYPFLNNFSELSFGMSGDYHIAAQMGSTMVRIGTSIFGDRNYNQ
ncbi:MAG: YggS family pyridoxal phosphate-dependent enzyme [Bacteroidales bacterium]|nr:YggS family pyridoxal phosphate-dependent enzyme [Bacteroidales bacterium]